MNFENFLLQYFLGALPFFWTSDMFIIFSIGIIVIFGAPIYYFFAKNPKNTKIIGTIKTENAPPQKANIFWLLLKSFWIFIFLLIFGTILLAFSLHKMSIFGKFPQIINAFQENDILKEKIKTTNTYKKFKILENNEKFITKMESADKLLHFVENNVNIFEKRQIKYLPGTFFTEETILPGEFLKLFQSELFQFNNEFATFLQHNQSEYNQWNLTFEKIISENNSENQEKLQFFAKKLKDQIIKHKKFAFLKDFPEEEIKNTLEFIQILFIAVSELDKEIQNL